VLLFFCFEFTAYHRHTAAKTQKNDEEMSRYK